jgi:hypothetical protein
VRWQLAWPETAVPGLGGILKETGRHPGALDLQHGVHHARHDHDLLRDHADPGRRLRQLLHPAHDRRRDMAFPLLNMLSFWITAVAGVIMLSGFFVEGGHAGAGWTSYVPLSRCPAYTGVNWGQNLWCISLFTMGIGLDDGLDQLHHDRSSTCAPPA